MAMLVLAVALLAAAALVVGLTTFNAVVAMQRRADKAWANVDVALKQRHDELPALVDAVRGVMAFERDVFEHVTQARAAYAPDASPARQAATSDATSAAVRSLFAVVERYPELRSEENVMALQREIERLEGLIATRRELYNDSVYLYNATIQQVPAVLFASLLRWRTRELFRAEPDDRAEVAAALPS